MSIIYYGRGVNALMQAQTVANDEVIIPLQVKRADVHKIKAVKISEADLPGIQAFADYLTDRGYTTDNSFAALFRYCYAYTHDAHNKAAIEEAKKETK